MTVLVTHPLLVGRRRRKALRVLAGVGMMAAFVLVTFAILFRFAGPWGVPYFAFTSDRGSPCKNNLTGFVCTPITLAEVEFHAEIDLPDDTRVVDGTYQSTHDYQLEALLDVPPGSADAALKALNESFGPCLRSQPSPLDTEGVGKLCTMATVDAITESGEPASRLYMVGTGVRRDGSRPIYMTIRSR